MPNRLIDLAAEPSWPEGFICVVFGQIDLTIKPHVQPPDGIKKLMAARRDADRLPGSLGIDLAPKFFSEHIHKDFRGQAELIDPPVPAGPSKSNPE